MVHIYLLSLFVGERPTTEVRHAPMRSRAPLRLEIEDGTPKAASEVPRAMRSGLAPMRDRLAVLAIIAMLLAVTLVGVQPSVHGPSGASLPARVGPSSEAVHRVGGTSGAVIPWAHHAGPVRDLGPFSSVLVSQACTPAGNAEVESATDPANGYIYDAWIGCGGIGFARSVDGGVTFQTAYGVPGSTTGTNGPYNNSWDPSIAVAPNGTVYVGFMVNNGTGGAPAVAWSMNDGVSFAGFHLAFLPSSGEFSDRDFVAVAPNGTLYLTWDYSPNASIDVIGCASGGSCYFTNGDYNILIVHSTDGGRNWSNPAPVDPEYPNGGAPCGPLIVAPNGTVEVLYEDYAVSGANHSLGLGKNYFSRTTTGWSTFSTPLAVSNLTFPNYFWWIDGAIAADPSGTLYATFDAQSGANNTAFVAVSRTGGTSWQPPIRLNPDNNSADHIMVQSAGGESGTAYLAWMADNNSLGWSTYFETLTGNGTKLSSPIVISDQYGAVGYWVGDTIGIVYLGNQTISVSWTYGVVVAGSLASEVFETVVSFALPGAPTITAIVPGAAQATLRWAAPVGRSNVGGYVVMWGVEGQLVHNVTLPGAVYATVLSGLLPNVHYTFRVAAYDAGGTGPASRPVNLTLTAWSILIGSVEPSNAVVTLDGIPLASPGGSFTANTTPGGHSLNASLSGWTFTATSVTLPWNSTGFQNLTLAPLPGVLTGRVVPSSAAVVVDGVALSVTPGGTFRTPAAGGTNHTVLAQAVGFVSRTITIFVPRNQTVYLNITLQRPLGVLEFVVVPASASLWVNGTAVPLDANGRANVSLPSGTYPVEAHAGGYQPYYANETVSAGATLPVSVLMVATGPGPVGGGGPDLGALFAHPPLWLELLIAIVVVGAVAGLLYWSRPRPPPPEEAPPEGELYGSTPPPTGPEAD